MMKKTAAFLLMIAMLLFSLAGCKTDGPGGRENGTPAPAGPSADAGKPVISGEIKTGNTVTFGSFEQDNDASDGAEPVEWIVLAVKDGRALLLSKYGLDCRPFNKDHTGATWENCSLREWLNGEFYNASFSDAEKAVIATSSLENADNPTEGTSGGNDTEDKVFVLSLDEAVNTEYGFAGEYDAKDKLRQCLPTEYAKAHNCLLEDNASSEFFGNCRWRLRTPSFDSDVIVDVAADGSIKVDGGFSIGGTMIAVRPALWIVIG